MCSGVARKLSENIESSADSAIARLMAEFSDSDRKRLLAIGQTVEYGKGEIVFQQGDPGDALFVVNSGTVEIGILSEEGKKLSLNVMKAGDVFGEIAALDGGIRTATATALQPVTMVKYRRSDLNELISSRSEMALKVIELLCGRIRWINQQVEDLAMLDVEGRLANRLLILYNRFAGGDGWLKMSQSDLADFLGVSRESTNKALQNWRAEGIIELSRGSIKITDASILRVRASTH